MRPGLITIQATITAIISLAAIHLAGAGQVLIATQAVAFVLGVAIAVPMARTGVMTRIAPQWVIGAVLIVAGAVLSFGVEIEGARRWLRLGPVLLHPASLLGSIMLLALARAGADRLCQALAGGAVLAFGLGVDGAASLAFAFGLTGLAAADRAAWRRWLPLCILAWGLAFWSLARVDTLPALPYVEQAISHSFARAPLAGLAAAAAAAMLPLPFLLAERVPGLRGAGLALAGFWLGLVLAGAFWNYPVPVLGYGASPVIGWVLALG